MPSSRRCSPAPTAVSIYLTVFAFSSENWKRPTEEVSGLMGLVLVAVAKYLTKLSAHGVRIRIIGDRAEVSDKLREAWEQAESSTRDNPGITLSVAFNYGGRWDVVQACRRAMHDGIDPDHLDETTLGRYMALSHAPDPDLFIRTGGELRISNFLLWQAAYSELRVHRLPVARLRRGRTRRCTARVRRARPAASAS